MKIILVGFIYLSYRKKAALIITDNELLFSKSTVFSKPNVILKRGRLCKIKKCKKDWCKVEVEKFNGWVKKDSLWGRVD